MFLFYRLTGEKRQERGGGVTQLQSPAGNSIIKKRKKKKTFEKALTLKKGRNSKIKKKKRAGRYLEGRLIVFGRGSAEGEGSPRLPRQMSRHLSEGVKPRDD